MAQLNITIKDTVLASATEAIAVNFGYTAMVADANGAEVPNPMTKDQFLKKQIKQWLRNQTLEHAQRVALANVTVEEDL